MEQPVRDHVNAWAAAAAVVVVVVVVAASTQRTAAREIATSDLKQRGYGLKNHRVTTAMPPKDRCRGHNTTHVTYTWHTPCSGRRREGSGMDPPKKIISHKEELENP